MPTFKPGDIVKAPFPYTDRATRQRRPVLVLAAGDLQVNHGLVWVLMITSAANRGWPGDVDFDHVEAGLPAESVVRTEKVATVDAAELQPLGRLPETSWAQVRARIVSILAD
ncbi:MAG: type II toxin-antitoxin system PemK/MazF family toxin [Phenylobacterium sp.]|jgi:mRNA interferase MazF